MYFSSSRTSDLNSLWSSQKNMTAARTKYSTLTEKIASGKNYLSRSENASATNEAESITISMSKNNQYITNLDNAATWEKVSDSNMQEMVSLMRRISALYTEGGSTQNLVNGGGSELATELEGHIESMYQSANSTYLGVSLFSGINGKTGENLLSAAYNAKGNIESISVDPNISETFTKRQVSSAEGIEIPYGTIGYGNTENGESLFAVSYTDSNDNTSNADLFQTLIDFRTYLEGDVDSLAEKYSTNRIVVGQDADGNDVKNPVVEYSCKDADGNALQYKNGDDVFDVVKSVHKDIDGNEVVEYSYTDGGGNKQILTPDPGTGELDLGDNGTIDPADVQTSRSNPSDQDIYSEIGNRLTQLQDNIIEKEVETAASQNRMTSLSTSATASYDASSSKVNSILEIDLSKAAVELSKASSSLEATYQMATKLSTLSILDYL